MSFSNSTVVGDPQALASGEDMISNEDSIYEPPDVELDEQAIAQQVFDDLATRSPGWTANDGNLDTWLIEAFAAIGAAIRDRERRGAAFGVPTFRVSAWCIRATRAPHTAS